MRPTIKELKKLLDYSDAEKVAWFDETYKQAMDDLESLEENEAQPKDCESIAFERCMELLGPGVWARWNAVEQ